MSREIYQKVGLILALVIAGVSLPTSLLSFMREPIINNNQTYYIYYNRTYYVNNETVNDYSKPLEQKEYYYLSQYDCIIRNFTLSSNFAYWCYYNASMSFQLRFYMARGIFFESVSELNGTIGLVQYMDRVKILENSFTGIEKSFYYIPPFLSEWLFIYLVDDFVSVNITLMDEITKI